MSGSYPRFLLLIVSLIITNSGGISENCLALQTGETLELLSSNRLAATPHFVNSTASSLGRKALEAIERNKEESAEWKSVESGVVSRETLAVFLQVSGG